MPVNFDRLNSPSPTPELKRPVRPQEAQQEHFKQQDLGQSQPPQTATQIQESAASAVSGLKQAELSYAAQAFQRLGEQFEADTNQIAQTAEILLDPRVKLATGILKAADRINTRQDAGLPLPFGGYSCKVPTIPGVPSFSQFYSPGQSSQPLLSSTSESDTSN